MTTSKASQPRKPKVCVYCGAEPATEMDHVIPRCLFPKPLPRDMVTVPACEKCNDEKKHDDEYLRDMLIIDIENQGHPITEGPLKGNLLRAARRKQSNLIRQALGRVRIQEVRSPAGLFLGHAFGMPIDHTAVNRTFARITRGLYYKIYTKRLPDDCSFVAGKISPLYHKKAVEQARDMGVQKVYRIGDHFECIYLIGATDSTVTFWIQRYFNIFVWVSTNFDKHKLIHPEVCPLTSWLGS